MSDAYQNQIMNSDLDAFKQSGILTGSVTFAAPIGAGQEVQLLTTPQVIDSLDFAQILFDNSNYHSGRYRDMSLENATMLNETTRNSQLQINVFQKITGNTIQFGATVFNPYDGAVNPTTTTVNFLYVPYQATI
jgi:hypothetical protein